ncbi:MAG: patatin-like phospholipase family protein [Peptococcales bacterium]|jgi:patatin-like phospholipase/acyl hydrolase
MGKYRIMSFDGGGIRGALTATLLKRLEQEYPQLIKEVNLFAGTSTGSFIALGLAYGLSITDISDLYSVENARSIFSPGGLGLFRPKYSNVRLREILEEYFPKDLRLQDLKKSVVIPSFKVIGKNKGQWSPVFFNNFPDSNTRNVRVIDAALASSAAPSYFPSYLTHVDGGLIANNPCMAAISIASDPYYANKVCNDICLLSIGTGYSPNKITADTTRWGLIQWIFNSTPPIPLQTIMFDGAVEADSYFSYQILKDRFYRLNPELKSPIGLGDYQQIPYLVSLGEKYNLEDIMKWLNRCWSPADFSVQYQVDYQDFDEKRARYWHKLHNKSF